uniref:Secreted protein n=1 Tax=Panagrellus redivivus TaxID=6233 RepID=A0A7E4URN7_PANRE
MPEFVMSTVLSLLWLLFPMAISTTLYVTCFKSRKATDPNAPVPPKGGYKPGHLPEFLDPDQKETNTFYDVPSAVAFPLKDEDGKPIQPPQASPAAKPGALDKENSPDTMVPSKAEKAEKVQP